MTLPVFPATVKAATPAEHAAWHNEIHTRLAESPAQPTNIVVTDSGHLAAHDAICSYLNTNYGTTFPTTHNELDPNHLQEHIDIHAMVEWNYAVLILTSDSNSAAQTKINNAASNAVVGFQGGTHFERKVTARLGQTYRGDPRGTTVLDGSRAITSWSGNGPWTASHTIADRGVFIDTTGVRTATGDDIGAQYPEELFFETPGANSGWTRKTRKGQPTTGAPGAGQWTMDYSSGTLKVAESPIGKNVRISVTDTAIAAPALAAGGLTIEDITFQKYATDLWHSAAGHGADHRDWTYRRVSMIDSHGSGFYLGPGDTVERCRSMYQGQDGFDGEGEVAGGYFNNRTIIDTEVGYNKQARYDWGWGGGGSKFDMPPSGSGLTIRNCWWHHNFGPAIWTDLNETETSTITIESNLVESNLINGIFIEIGNNPTLIRWNTVLNCNDGSISPNGGPLPDDESCAGIDISNSRNCTVQQNKVIDCPTGIMIRDDGRDPFLDGANVTGNHVRLKSGSNGNTVKFRPDASNARIATCGADNNKYWNPLSLSYNNVFGMSFAAWQAARSGPGLTGALDPNGQAGLTGTVTDPVSFVPFVLKRYGPGMD